MCCILFEKSSNWQKKTKKYEIVKLICILDCYKSDTDNLSIFLIYSHIAKLYDIISKVSMLKNL